MEIIIFIKNLFAWLISGNSAGILTITTGFIAWLVYKSQVKLREREAAIILLNEIRHAESTLGVINSTGLDVQNEIISILPTCSWDTNYQIFAHYLNNDEFRLLSEFFNGCKATQSELEQWRRYFIIGREEKAKAIQTQLVNFAIEHEFESQDYKSKSARLKNGTDKEDFLFSFIKPKIYFEKYFKTIPQISGTTIFEKLNKLSK